MALYLNLKSATNCGLLIRIPQGMVFLALVRTTVRSIRRVAEAVEKPATRKRVLLFGNTEILNRLPQGPFQPDHCLDQSILKSRPVSFWSPPAALYS